jgi:spore germination protein KC
MKKRIAALLCILIMVSLLQGCWNYREVDNLQIVAGVAVDRGYEGHKFHLTIDLADTTKAGKDKPVISTLVESEGDTIFNAVNNASARVGMQLYWENCQIAVISQDVAQESIIPVIDWLNRDLEPRITMELFISQERTAKEILKQQSTTMSITSFEIDKLYELNEQVQPIAEYSELYQISNTLAHKGSALVLPALRIADNIDDKVCILNGMAVFDGDRLIGYLTPTDSKYAMFVTNHVKGGSLEVKASTGNTIGSLKIFGNTTSVKTSVEDGKLKVSIETKTDVSMDELDTRMNYTDKDKIGEYEMMAESQLAAEIGKTIQIVQSQYGKDIFGFGDVLHRSDPGAWYTLQQNWDEAFRTAKIQVSCKIKIRNRGENISPERVAR